MTKPPPKARNARAATWAKRIALPGIMLLALGLRLEGVGFGLPALNDPDEPLFVMTALDMLRNHSMNPGWFGHPGTMTFYALMLVILGVVMGGLGTGRFADVDAFTAAVYADPSIIFLPARLFFVICGVACVWLTYRIGKRLSGPYMGLVAAAILAVNAVHIQYSQIIRTDMQASLFMLLCVLCALTIAERGRVRDYALAGLFLGLACATKWPAALIGISVVGAWLSHAYEDRWNWKGLVCFALCAILTLVLVSPYLLIDHDVVVRHLTAEGRPTHPGATGEGFGRNFLWYAGNPLLASMGWAGLVMAAIGLFYGVGKWRRWNMIILPFCLIFLCVISLQSLRWERWVVPLLPILALACARGLCGLVDYWTMPVGRRGFSGWLAVMLTVAVLGPMLLASLDRARERNNDTRQMAAGWVRDHIPAGRSIVMEHAGLDLLRGPWPLRFPLGQAGCIDVRAMLAGRIRYDEVEEKRAGSAIVDLGHVNPQKLTSCAADYAIISHYTRYQEAAHLYPAPIARYRALLADGHLMAEYSPEKGRSSGPVVQIYRLGKGAGKETHQGGGNQPLVP